MTTSSLMVVGTRAMQASYSQLQVTGNNIANANVEGYSRQQAQLNTAWAQYTGSGYYGKGVEVATVSRSYDQFLTKEMQGSRSLAQADKTRLDYLQQLERSFPLGEQGVGYAANQFLNAMVDVASHPGDSSARQVVLSRAGEAAARFTASAQQIETMQQGVNEDLRNSIASVNKLAQNIAQTNQEIAKVIGLGHEPNQLLDKRDQLIADLGQYIQVTTVPARDGTLGVFVGGGQRLVLGAEATQLKLMPDSYDSSRAAIGMVEVDGSTRLLRNEMLAGGSIAGAIRFQNSDLAAARDALGQMAAAMAGAVNRQQSLGLDLRQPPGTGAPIFSTGAAQALAATTNARDGAGNYIASVSLAIADSSQLQASEYELQADPANAGQYLLTRRSDGLQRSIANGATVDGMTINVGVPAPGTGDRFLLQPVANAAVQMRRVLDDPKGIAAALAVEASATVGNTGTATVGGLQVVSPSVNPQNTATISFTSATGAYSWELRDRSSNALVSSGTGSWQAGQPIALNGFELSLDGVPASGDSFKVGRTAFPESSNTNAAAMVGLRDARIVGKLLDSAGQPVGGATLTDAYASAMAGVGVRVSSTKAAADISSAVATNAKNRKESATGVNLDEEAARLIQFQQSYQAAAKVLTVAQTIFDTLLQAAAR